MPTDPNFLLMSDEQLHWLQHVKRNYLRELFDGLGTILGTRMTSEEFWGTVENKSNAAEKRDVVSFPLSFLLGDRTDHAFRTALQKPDGHKGGNGGKADLRDLYSPAQLKEIFGRVRTEADQMIQDVKSITPP